MKCDLHVHTHYSYDSTSLLEDIIKEARKNGIDCLAITDHHEVRGAREIKDLTHGNPLIIPGIEVKSEKGDILGLKVNKKIPDGLTVRESIKRIKEQGGMAIIPHPFSFLCPFKGDLKEYISEIDGIEILNASAVKQANQKAKKFVKKNNIAFTAGSDAHAPESIGNAYLEIPGQGLSVEQVLEAIKNREGQVRGKETGLFKKTVHFIKRNLAKLHYYVSRTEKKI